MSEEQVKRPVKIMETILRDAHQSLIATRMPTSVMLPIVEKLDHSGEAVFPLDRLTAVADVVEILARPHSSRYLIECDRLREASYHRLLVRMLAEQPVPYRLVHALGICRHLFVLSLHRLCLSFSVFGFRLSGTPFSPQGTTI